jgi:hypothetical protein
MSEPQATSFEALVIKGLIDLLAGSANFQALTGSQNADAAKARIIEVDGGLPLPSDADAERQSAPKAYASTGTRFSIALAHGIVSVDSFPAVDVAHAYSQRSWSGIIQVVIPPTSGDVPPWAYRRFLNIAGAIRADIATAWANLGLGAVALDPQPLTYVDGWLPDHRIAKITINGRTP